MLALGSTLPRPVLMLGLLFFPLSLCSAITTTPSITEADLLQIRVQELQLGMDKSQVNQLLEQHFPNTKKADPAIVTAFNCAKNQCLAQRFAADGSTAVTVHFNNDGKVYWIAAQMQAQLASSAEECLRLAGEQLAALRQAYSPENQQYFYGQNTITFRLNKLGHPDPAENSLYGFSVKIKCDPLAKGLAQTEYELRDNAL